MKARTRLIMDFSHPFKGSGAVSNGLSGIKSASPKCLFIFNWSYLTTDKKLKDRGRANVGVVPSKWNVWGRIWIRTVFLVFVWGIHSWILSKHFRYTLYSDKPLRQNAQILVPCTRYWPEGPHWTITQSMRFSVCITSFPVLPIYFSLCSLYPQRRFGIVVQKSSFFNKKVLNLSE
jgi:hypothetical protein